MLQQKCVPSASGEQRTVGLTLGKAAQSSWPGKMSEFIGRAVGSQSVLNPGGLEGRSWEGELVWGTGKQQSESRFLLAGWAV